MLDSELFSNYYASCIHYAYTNSTNTLPDEGFVTLINNTGKSTATAITISEWNHASSEPSYTELLVFDSVDVANTYSLWQKKQRGVNTETLNMTGPWSGTNPLNIECQGNNGLVSICIEGISINGDNLSTAPIESTSSLSSKYIPSMNLEFPVIVEENSSLKNSCLEISSSGYIKIYSTVAKSSFISGLGTYGIKSTVINYMV